MSHAIVYLPGFCSGPQSEKSVQLKQKFPALIAVAYDSLNPDNSYRQINASLEDLVDNKPLLIGSSLGGFWAYQFAKKYGLKCLLLNPCMTPEASLRPAVGPVQNFYSGERGVLTVEDLLKYENYRFEGTAQCTVLHEKGDELIPYHESVTNFEGKTRLVLVEGGNHRFMRMDVVFAEIDALLQSP